MDEELAGEARIYSLLGDYDRARRRGDFEEMKAFGDRLYSNCFARYNHSQDPAIKQRMNDMIKQLIAEMIEVYWDITDTRDQLNSPEEIA